MLIQSQSFDEYPIGGAPIALFSLIDGVIGINFKRKQTTK